MPALRARLTGWYTAERSIANLAVGHDVTIPPAWRWKTLRKLAIRKLTQPVVANRARILLPRVLRQRIAAQCDEIAPTPAAIDVRERPSLTLQGKVWARHLVGSIACEQVEDSRRSPHNLVVCVTLSPVDRARAWSLIDHQLAGPRAAPGANSTGSFGNIRNSLVRRVAFWQMAPAGMSRRTEESKAVAVAHNPPLFRGGADGSFGADASTFEFVRCKRKGDVVRGIVSCSSAAARRSPVVRCAGMRALRTAHLMWGPCAASHLFMERNADRARPARRQLEAAAQRTARAVAPAEPRAKLGR
jgi:hypothetical protein